MKQIFERFAKYLKSEINYIDIDISHTDNDLKKIIEDLNTTTNKDKQNPNTQERKINEDANNSKMDLKKACEILEIPIDADIETIQNSYRKLVKEYHPDKVNNMGKEIRLLAQKKTIEINQAYEYIKNFKNI